MRSTFFTVPVLSIGLLACGGTTPAPTAPPTEAPDTNDRGAPEMYAELGVLDEGEVRSTFERLWKTEFEKCQKSGNEFVAGNVVIKMRVNHSGGVKWAYLGESDLGDREVEKCILESIRGATWPIPEGGEDGLAEQQMPFAEQVDRPPVEWTADRVEPALDKAKDKLDSCREGSASGFRATAIIRTNGSPAAVGMAPPDENSESAVDCLVDVIKGLKFPTTGSWPAKVTFDVP